MHMISGPGGEGGGHDVLLLILFVFMECIVFCCYVGVFGDIIAKDE